MIPKTVEGTITDELEGEEIEFSIGNPAWVMHHLAKLYSNTAYAVIREYSTNARDAMIEADRREFPIEVTLPSTLGPEFIVKDTGVGMSLTELRKTYTKFGNSTKHQSNDTNGYLGFGSKSGIAYTSSFTVDTVKHGKRNIGVISKRPDMTIFLKLVVKNAPTTDPNGTTIRVPVHNSDEFCTVARDFYRFWTPGTIEVNGKEPEWEVGEKLNDSMYISRNDRSYVVMGNVPYQIHNPEPLFSNRAISKFDFVLYVNNGAVEFVPSREALEYSDLTKATLRKEIDGFEAEIMKKAQEEINSATTHWEAYKAHQNWSSKVGKVNLSSLNFNGDDFISRVPTPGVLHLGQYGRAYSSYDMSISEVNENGMVITNCPLKRLTGVQLSRIREYCQAVPNMGISGHSIRNAYFLNGDFDNIWINPKRIVDWATVVKATRPTYANNGTKSGPSTRFTVISADSYKEDVDITTYKESQMMWVPLTDLKKKFGYNSQMKILLNLLKTKKVVVAVSANRLAKFKREFPKVKPFREWAVKQVKLDMNQFYTPAERMATGIDWYVTSVLRLIDCDQIDDPDVKLLKSLMDKKIVSEEANRHLQMAQILRLPVIQVDAKKGETFSLFGRYPLIKSMSSHAITDAYVYMNAKYASLEEEKDDDSE